MNAADHLGPLDLESPPEVVLVLERRRQLFAALRNGGTHLQPHDLAWAQHWARVKPLGRALSAGDAT